MDKKVQDILSKMTLEDKISLCNGADFWHSKAMAQYGIPAVTMSDGPHGVRCQKNGARYAGCQRVRACHLLPDSCDERRNLGRRAAESRGTGHR